MTNQRIEKHPWGNGEADVCIVGAGAAGGVLAKELATAGLKVVVLEAGPYFDPQDDWVSDELVMDHKLSWTNLRLTEGKNPLKLGYNLTGKGVGGTTNHFTAVLLRFHESDFKVKSTDGVGEDWPIEYKDLEPYYAKIEKEVPVSGPKHFPWGPFNGPYPYPERDPVHAVAEIFMRGCEKLGVRSSVVPTGILSAPYEGRPPCTNRGFCNQGCTPNAKFSTLITYIPHAVNAGAHVVAEAMVTRVNVNKEGRVTGVNYLLDGKEYVQEARVVILAGFVIENPRLLLNSDCPQFPDGLANSSGLVGKYIMAHSSHDVYAKFDKIVRPYKGSPVMATTLDFYDSDSKRGFVRGYCIHSHGFRPVSFVRQICGQYLLWGPELRELTRDYNYYNRLTLVGEVLPDVKNQVTLDPHLKDEYGLPVPRVSFSFGENDLKLIADGVQKCKAILEAAGGITQYVVEDTAHLLGGCRMGDDPKDSVVDRSCRTHDIPNLFICDGSVFVTSAGVNPTLTVMALAARTADNLVECFKTGEF